MNRPEVNKTYIQKKLSKCQLSENQKNLLVKYLVRPIAYVPNDNIQYFDRMKSIIDQNIKGISGESLAAGHKQILFQQMNYARYRMSQVRRMILSNRRWPESALHELLHWHQFQQEAYSKIATANSSRGKYVINTIGSERR
jgi:hypothetical protein